MDNFDKEFVMNMFLDDDNVCTMNKVIVAVSNIVNENNDIITRLSDVTKDELKQCSLNSNHNNYNTVPTKRYTKNFYEHIARKFTEDDYNAGYKMQKNTVQELIKFLRNHVTSGTICLEKKVHVFLWLLVNGCSYTECGKLFGLHKSTISYIFNEIAIHLNQQRHHFISWPSLEEQHMTRIKVNSRFKFPNCVGFIDVCQFKVGTKRNNGDKPDVLLLQAVCDEKLMFTHIYIGEIGCTKKNKVFKESKLSQELKNYLEFENHILGDSEYKLRNNLITPFTSEELLTSEDMKFNEIHWKTHKYISRAFELLKERFKKLNHIDVIRQESVSLLISAACILHNFILVHEGSSEIKDEIVTCDDGVTINTSIVETAAEKRQFLCNYINFIDDENL